MTHLVGYVLYLWFARCGKLFFVGKLACSYLVVNIDQLCDVFHSMMDLIVFLLSYNVACLFLFSDWLQYHTYWSVPVLALTAHARLRLTSFLRH